jgi:hypothetical protein
MGRWWTVAVVALVTFGAASGARAQVAAGAEANAEPSPSASPATLTGRLPLRAFTTLPPPNIWVQQLEPALRPARQRPTALPPLYASLIGLEGVDAYTTSVGVSHGAQEQNAVLGAFGPSGIGGIGLKAASVVSMVYVSERLWKRHPVGAVLLMTAMNCAMAAVAVNNFSVIHRP